MDDLPADWLKIHLNEIAEIIMGQSPPSSSYNFDGKGLPFFQGKSEFQSLYPKPVKYCDQPSKIAQAGDILLSVRAPVGPTNLCEEISCIGRGLAAIRPIPVTSSRYLLQYFRFIEPSLSKQGTGSTFTAISKKDVQSIGVLLAPLPEQARIVAKLEKLLAKVDACKERLEKIPAILKRFRQSVLAAACAGDLTRDWRNEKTTSNFNQQKKCGYFTKDSKENFEISNSSTSLRLLPNTWEWVALGNYAELSRGRFSARPRNDPKYFDGKHPFIQIGDLPKDGGFISSHRQTLNDLGLSVSKKFPTGTVVIAIVGATIGNTGILSYEMCFPDSLVGINTGTSTGNVFIELFLRTEKEKLRTISYSSGGQPNIKLETLNPYPFPCPPIDEQHEIVRRVEALFKIADDIEKRYRKAKAHVDKLTQSILAKAFRGELVPQNPNDEPAAELLKRIQAERKKQEAEARPGRKSARRRVKDYQVDGRTSL